MIDTHDETRLIDSSPASAAVAARLDDAVIHVWRLAYDRRHGRQPLLALLAVYTAIPEHALELIEGAHGRPELAAANGLSFNWSHCGDHAMLAIARGVAPGIDLERWRVHPRALEIARRYFTAAETERLAALHGYARSEMFLRLWTAKEAVLKALGHGIAFGLHRLSFDLDGHGPTLNWLDGDHAGKWQLHPLAIDASHVGALAWRGGPRRIEIRSFEYGA